MRCENKSCRTETSTLHVVKSPFKRIDLCGECYLVFLDVIKAVFENVRTMEDSDVEALKSHDTAPQEQGHSQFAQ